MVSNATTIRTKVIKRLTLRQLTQRVEHLQMTILVRECVVSRPPVFVLHATPSF